MPLGLPAFLVDFLMVWGLGEVPSSAEMERVRRIEREEFGRELPVQTLGRGPFDKGHYRAPFGGVFEAGVRGNVHVPGDGPAVGQDRTDLLGQRSREFPIDVGLHAEFER